MTSISTTVVVLNYITESFGSSASFTQADEGIDVTFLDDVDVGLTEDAASLFRKGARLKVTFEEEQT